MVVASAVVLSVFGEEANQKNAPNLVFAAVSWELFPRSRRNLCRSSLAHSPEIWVSLKLEPPKNWRFSFGSLPATSQKGAQNTRKKHVETLPGKAQLFKADLLTNSNQENPRNKDKKSIERHPKEQGCSPTPEKMPGSSDAPDSSLA